MGGTSYADERAYLGAYGALKSSEHGVGLFVLHGDDEVGKDGGVLLFFCFYDVGFIGGPA